MKKYAAIILSFMMAVSLIACGSSSTSVSTENESEVSNQTSENAQVSEASKESSWTYNFTATTPLGDTHSSISYWNNIFNELSERSGGRITGKIYPSSQLAGGDMTTSIDMVQKGTIDIFVGGAPILGSYVPEFYLTNCAFVFTNDESCDNTLNNVDVMNFYREKSSDKGFYFLGWMENGWYEITNNKRELINPEDMSGLIMRVPNGNDALIAAYEAVGASTVNIDLGELYTSLQQGVCDGQENGIAGAITANKLYEVQKYMTYCQYSYCAFSCMMNQALWESIPASDQEMIQEVFDKYAKEQIQSNRDAMESCLKEVENYGMIVHVMTDEERVKWMEAMGPSSDKVQQVLNNGNYDPDFVELFFGEAEKNNGL